MAIEYKTNDVKATLLEIAVSNGIEADDSMTRAQIIAAIDTYNAAEGANVLGVETVSTAEAPPADGTQDTQEGTAVTTEAAEIQTDVPPTEDVKTEYDMFVYVGPSLPGGSLKENAVFRGTFDDVLKYLADVLEKYPQAEKLIVPTHRLAEFSAKVKKKGNIAHKYYNDLVSTMRNHKEV
ncbi:hypothetical protein SDC9_122522 [bioreactor metagenome]|uniref:Uncharacterized protein n=1 Tax=bioreactor metagenome TaxID=1076179 RepID=A0A645CEX8_9ZZZZ|nr:hypothetical protein [Anaerotignum propionicum]MEA5057771.1 hypothetical protein [Anaerotignum propionicum]